MAVDLPNTLVNFFHTKWYYFSEDNITFIVTVMRTSDFTYSKFAEKLLVQVPNRKFDQL
jgi:hypothetical protein